MEDKADYEYLDPNGKPITIRWGTPTTHRIYLHTTEHIQHLHLRTETPSLPDRRNKNLRRTNNLGNALLSVQRISGCNLDDKHRMPERSGQLPGIQCTGPDNGCGKSSYRILEKYFTEH